jgi:hypothetical protein
MKNMKKVLFGLTILASLGAITLQAQPLWTDSMAYPVGLITTNSDGLWLNHSGNQDTFVQTYPGSAAALAGNRYEVNQTRTGDIHRWFVPANTNRYAAGSNTVLYASFTVSVTNLPAYPNGTYFAHFMDNGTFFRGRIFTVLPPNPYPFISAAPGMFRFGIACAQGDAAPGASTLTNGPAGVVPIDLALDTDYQVVMRYELDNNRCSLWVNPAAETDDANSTGLVFDNNSFSSTNFLAALAFRQSLGEGILEIRDVMVSTSFADVVTNTPANALPVIGQQPISVTNYSGNPAILEVAASGMGILTYQWYQNNALLPGATSQLYLMNSLGGGDVGSYYCAVSNSAGGTLSSPAYVSVNTTLTTPTITSQPQNATNYVGETARFTAFGVGTGPLTYQWQHAGIDLVDGPVGLPGDACVISGSQSPYLTLTAVGTNEIGNYTVVVTSGGGTTPPSGTSDPAYLSVLAARQVSIAFLRSLEDHVTWAPTDTTTLYSITGINTVITNQSAGQSSYYIQDATGGLNLFVSGTTTFRPALGDLITAVGTLSSFNNNLELVCLPANPNHIHVVISNSILLPAPFVFSPLLTNNSPLMETNIEGRVVMLTNVYFPAGSVSATANTTVTVTNGGMTFLCFFAAGQNLDLRSKPYPPFAWTVTGVLNQYKTSTYSQAGYEVNVSRWGDVVTNAPAAVAGAATVSGNDVVLTWPAAPPYSTAYTGAYCYSVLAATDLTGPWVPLATGLTFANTAGTYTDVNGLLSARKFYRISSP